MRVLRLAACVPVVCVALVGAAMTGLGLVTVCAAARLLEHIRD